MSRAISPEHAGALNFPTDLTGGSPVYTHVGAQAAVYRRPDGATTLTMLFSSATSTHTAQLSPIAFPGAATFSSADASADTVTMTGSHGLVTGDGPYQLTEVGTLPPGLAEATDYWVYVVSATVVQFCASRSNAIRKDRSSMDGEIDAPIAVDITGANTGSNTLDSGIPAVTATTGTGKTFTLIAGFESRPHVFTAPEVITVDGSAAGARIQFWWS